MSKRSGDAYYAVRQAAHVYVACRYDEAVRLGQQQPRPSVNHSCRREHAVLMRAVTDAIGKEAASSRVQRLDEQIARTTLAGHVVAIASR